MCFGDRVVFRCTVTGPGVLKWAIESINTLATTPIKMNVALNGTDVQPSPYPEVSNVTLVTAVQDPDYPFLGNLTSEITILVTTNTLGKQVYCGDGRQSEEGSPSVTIFGCKK